MEQGDRYIAGCLNLMEPKRKLAALLFADVVGYSRLVGADEAGAVARVRQFRQAVLEPALAKRSGRLVKSMGDGFLAEFGSVVDATRLATELQELLSASDDLHELRLRMGVHMGEVIVDGDDLLGEGVNIAARLQAFAEPGSICLSADAYRQVEGKLPLHFQDGGEQRFKNIERPVRVYIVTEKPKSRVSATTPPLPDRPSIAVLPFQNMSGDPEQEYFADGMVEDIITALSRFRNLFVIARNSSFTYKGRAVDVKQVGRELGVRYVLEGSVRKAGAQVRITGQLINASNGAHIWADRFDGDLKSVFELQDQVTERVVGAIAPTLEQAEIERAKLKPTESLDAYDHYLRGLAPLHRWTKEGIDQALEQFQRAIEKDPEFGPAYGLAASCYAGRKANAWMIDNHSEIAEAERLARLAITFGKNDAIALAYGGMTLALVALDLKVGASAVDRAIVLNSNLSVAWHWRGWTKLWLGDPEGAIESQLNAMRLSPLDPFLFHMQAAVAHGHFFSGRYAEAAEWAATSLREQADLLNALRIGAASNALLGNMEEAREMVARLEQHHPMLRLSNLKNTLGPYPIVFVEKYIQGLRSAGFPE